MSLFNEETNKPKRAGVHEIIPGKLYQRGQFLTWPYKQKRALLDRYSITMVVNLWSKIDSDLSPEEHNRIYLNWYCSPSEIPPNAGLLINWLVDALQARYRILIHCEAGKGRSVWLTTRVVASYLNISTEAALTKVESVLKHDLTETLLLDLKQTR